MALVKWSGHVGQIEVTQTEPTRKLTRIEWFAILGLAISMTSLLVNLYRTRSRP